MEKIKFYTLATIAGLTIPLLLIPLVHITGYSEIIEEIVKGIMILLLILPYNENNVQLKGAIIFGALFGFSESMFYLSNFISIGNSALWFKQMAISLPIHILTVIIILCLSKISRKLFIPSIAIASILHILINSAL